MRVLVVADIHGNWPALRAVAAAERFDLCFCLGDLVDYGLDPAPCVAWVREHATHLVRGNHDHAFAQRIPGQGESGLRLLAAQTRALLPTQLAPADRAFLGTQPLTRYARVDGKTVLLLHATPRDPLDEYVFAQEDAWRRRLEGVAADIVCVGHTHHPFVLPVDKVTVVNPGSVGQPRDGDPRASYAVIDGGAVSLHRVEYDVEEAVRAVERSDLSDAARRTAIDVLRHGRSTAEPEPTEANPRVHAPPAAEAEPNADGTPAPSRNGHAHRE